MRATWTLALIFLVVLVRTLSAQSDASRIAPAADAPKPLSPEESAKRVKLPAGFRLELIASEPLVKEPSGVCWDERGRFFVCELHGYNLDGHYDIEDLNKTGKLDREVRRIQATDEAKKKADAETTGAVKRLIDTDGDGRIDKAEVWADDLPPCYGMVAARGGLIVACAPHIVFLADRDSNGKPEVRETLFTGFPAGILERRMNCPQWGLDGWIYFGTGGGGTITGPHLKEPVTLPRTDFRIKPDGSAIEPVSGITWGMGFTFTETDERLVSSVGWPATYIVPLPWNSLARNPYLPSPSLNDTNPPDRRAYPISQPHPWRTKRADDPGFSKFYTDRYGIAESAPNGYFTSCCSPLVYQDSALPGLRGHMLACEPAQNLITRMKLDRSGSRLLINRVSGEEESEFFASTDQWFHPIALSHAPDGTIVVSDFYREIIEDYSAIPRYLQQQYSLIAGRDHGRLWRLTHESVVGRVSNTSRPASQHKDGLETRPTILSDLTPAQLVAELSSPRHWRRQTAHRLLVERGDMTVVPLLAKLTRESKETAVVLHALYSLAELKQLKPDDIVTALKSSEAGVRVHALRIAEPMYERDEAVLGAALELFADPDHRVRLQLALSLGEPRGPEVLEVLARLAMTSANDEPWLATAIASSSADRCQGMLSMLLLERSANPKLPPAALELIDKLALTTGTRRDDDQIGMVLSLISESLNADGDSAIRQRLLDGLISGLKDNLPKPLESEWGQKAIGTLLASSSTETSGAALRLAGMLRLTESPAMKAAWSSALATAMNDGNAVAKRVAAITLLSAAPVEQNRKLTGLLDAKQPQDVQLAVVRSLSASTSDDVPAALMANFAGLSPDVRLTILDAICSRSDRLPKLLDLIEQQTISPGDLPAIRRVQLLEHSNAALRTRAAKLLVPATSAERKASFERYRAALGSSRDAAAGKQVFEKSCAKCHQLGKEGFAVGPDLDSVRTRPDESLLLDILDPSGTINPKFRAYTVATTSGRVVSGLLASESATSITLRREKNETETILRKDIDELKASSKSLMPEGVEKDISPKQLADLIAYLRESLGPPLVASKVLFDDEPSFVAALKDGDAAATLITTDKHSGEAALRMTPLQRSATNIAGWNFRIVEKPAPTKPGEPEQFRYLRFAWKTTARDAKDVGVMFEFAASGQWPPADKPLRRYYSGKNTSGWAATQVLPDAPTEWTTVTVDLWKDFGDFTLTGIAPTAMGAPALFDRIELLRDPETR